VLIMGPAGCGKTMLAKALAGSVERPVYVIPSAEIDARLIRQVYAALAGHPCVIVWDEVDVLLRARWHRASDDGGRNLAAFCAALDGAQPLAGPITLGLTAEDEHLLDRQALRAGRLTTHITLGLPEREERLELWRRYTAGVPLGTCSPVVAKVAGSEGSVAEVLRRRHVAPAADHPLRQRRWSRHRRVFWGVPEAQAAFLKGIDGPAQGHRLQGAPQGNTDRRA
jgi:AAA+ superfamily predicted ATPase